MASRRAVEDAHGRSRRRVDSVEIVERLPQLLGLEKEESGRHKRDTSRKIAGLLSDGDDAGGSDSSDEKDGTAFTATLRSKVSKKNYERRQTSQRRRRGQAREDAREQLHSLALVDDLENVRTSTLDMLVGLLKNNRGFPNRTNPTRFEINKEKRPQIFLTSKYSEEGAQVFANCFAANSAGLRRIHIGPCHFGTKSMHLLFTTMAHNASITKSLHKLSIDRNTVGWSAARALADFCATCEHLEELSLTNCGMDAESMEEVLRGLASCRRPDGVLYLSFVGRQDYSDDGEIRKLLHREYPQLSSCELDM
eukprot:g1937.t1